MAKKETSVDGYVIAQCQLIASNPEETPERRKLAQQWLDKLTTNSAQDNWGNGGQTVAESRGIEVRSDAPGGQKVEQPGGVGRAKNEEARARSEGAYYGGPLSSDVSRSYRTGH